MHEGLSALQEDCPEIRVFVNDCFMSESEFAQAIGRADILVLPYQRNEGSSGMLGHAARYGRFVIGPSGGLIGDLIEAYGLGWTVNTLSAENLARKIEDVINEIPVPRGKKSPKDYISERRPDSFAEAILLDLM